MIDDITTLEAKMIACRLLALSFFIKALVIEATGTAIVNGRTVFEMNLKVGSRDLFRSTFIRFNQLISVF